MKNILCIATQCPLPCTDGGKMEIFYPMKYLSKYMNVHFSSFVTKTDDTIIENFNKYKIKFYPYELNTNDNYFKYPTSLFSKRPFKFNKYYDKEYLDFLDKIVKENNIETIWTNFPHMATYAIELKKKNPHLQIFLREHNLEFELVRQYSKSCKNIFTKIISYFEYLKTKIYETSLWNKFDKVFFISDSDLEMANKHKSFTEKNLIYSAFERNEDYKYTEIEDNSFIFTGSLNSFQNINNLKHFIDTIWINFVKEHPESNLYLTGSTDEKIEKCLGYTIKFLNSLNVINLGFVDNVQETILSKKYVVSPTLYGSGIRLKVIEAMGLKKIVFVLDTDYKMCKYFKDMENIVHYWDINSFKDKYEKLEADNEFYNNISKCAGELTKKIFDWDQYAQTIVDNINNKI